VKPTVTVHITPDTSQLAHTARIIAKHLTALADELEAPDGIITFDGDLSDEQVAEAKARFDLARHAVAARPITKPCPNDPPCPHPDVVHDIYAPDDPRPMCCILDCSCGKVNAP
jgi:hypothetical protein